MSKEDENIEEAKRLLKENSYQGLSCTCRSIMKELLDEEETELEEYDEYWDCGKHEKREKKYSHVIMDLRIPKSLEKDFKGWPSYDMIEDTFKNILINMIICGKNSYDLGELDGMRNEWK